MNDQSLEPEVPSIEVSSERSLPESRRRAGIVAAALAAVALMLLMGLVLGGSAYQYHPFDTESADSEPP